jgi:hypothetical protein
MAGKVLTWLAPGVGCVERSEKFAVQIEWQSNRRGLVHPKQIGLRNTPRVWVDSVLHVRGAKTSRVGHRWEGVNVVGPRCRVCGAV